MSATVELKVNLAYEQAYKNLLNLETYVNALTKAPYTIKFDVQGLDAVSKEALQFVRVQAQAQKAAEQTAKAQAQASAKAAQARAQEVAAVQRSIQAHEQTAKAQAQASAKAAQARAQEVAAVQRSIQAHEQTAQAMERTSQAQERTAQTANQLATARERTYQAEERTSQAMERTIQSVNKLSTEQEKTAQTANRLASEQERTARSTQNAGTAAQNATGGFSALSVAMGNIASRAFHLIMRKIAQGVREALTEMKNVDTELTNISKVGGKTGAELEAIGDAAYSTASKYGVAASEYLSAVYDMQKAGMGDQSEQMGELAIKTMLVGDTTQDVASKFLLASNAAWKLNGDMGRLTQIVDEADYINNNYATSLDKLAAGMPIVASVAAQAGMSAEETIAALGTITTVTQESGTKAATALRALILNIEGQVGKFVTEEGEEFEVTEESVKSLQGLLEKYAKTEMDAARAAGELIDPMTAIEALFKGMAESDLTDAELFTLLSSMGGKLRTNQLTALVQNYGLFEEMLERVADAAGTADGEIELMMNSWERKTQVLKNTWTELIADIVDTGFIKNTLDLLTEFVDGIDDAVNRLKDPFYDSKQTQKTYDELKAEYDALVAKGGDLNSVERARLDYLEKQLAVLQLKQEMEEQAAAKKLQNQLTNNRQDERSLTLYSRESGGIEFTGDIVSYQQSLKDLNAEWSDYYKNLISVRDAGIELTYAQQQFLDLFESNQITSMADIMDVRPTLDGYYALIDAHGKIVDYVEDQSEAQQAQIDSYRGNEEVIADLISKIEDLNAAREAYDAAESVEEEREAYRNLDEAQRAYDEAIRNANQAEIEAAESATGVADAAGGIAPQVDAATEAVASLIAAFQAAAAAAGSISVNVGGGGLGSGTHYGGMKIGGGGRASGTKNAPGGPTLVNELGPELISENGRAYIANGGRPGIVNLSRGAIVLTAKETQAAMQGGGGTTKNMRAAASGSHTMTYGQVLLNGVNIANTSSGRNVVISTTPTAPQSTGSTTKTGSGKKSSGGSSGGRGSSGSSSKKAGKSLADYASELKDLLSNLDKQAKLADNEGEYEKEVKIWEQAQEAIKTMVDRYRKAGYKDDSDEILDLLNKNYDYANKQLKMYQTKWDELVDALEADTDAQELANKLAEKQQAVDEAREALANAQNQRTIRMYNAATGQWEWVADDKKISSAQKSLTTAEKNYSDELKSQALKELEAMKDTIVDLNDVVLGPALSAVAMMAQDSNEFQNFARALNAVYGIGTYLASTEGSSKVLDTKDSHDTVYSFGDLVLTEEQAGTMTLKDLAQRLTVLNLS